MEHEMIVQLQAQQAFIPKIPCAVCGQLFPSNGMHFAVERGHAVHRCFPCAKREGLLDNLEASDRSADEEQKLFDEAIESDPSRVAFFLKESFGGGDDALRIFAQIFRTQLLVTMALKPGSPSVLKQEQFLFNVLCAGAADRRAEQDLSRKSDSEIEELVMKLAQKAIVRNASSNIPALAAPRDRSLSTSTGGTGEVAGVAEGAEREAVREPQFVGAAA